MERNDRLTPYIKSSFKNSTINRYLAEQIERHGDPSLYDKADELKSQADVQQQIANDLLSPPPEEI